MSVREPTRGITDALCEARGRGLSVRASCRHAGISVNTYYRWKREAEAFAVLDRMREAGLTLEEIEAVVAALEREREGQR
jgi:pentatricopeptide repeat protein